MKTRLHEWLDLKTMRPRFGVQVCCNRQWRHVAENGKPCVYETEAEAERKRTELRKLKPNA